MSSGSPESTDSDATTALFSAPGISDDILIMVFQLLVLDEVPTNRGCGSTPAQYPWTFAAVCKRWRAVCLQSAILWSYIELPVHRCATLSPEPTQAEFSLHRTLLQIERSKAEFCLYRIVLQLERSRDAPLIIHVDSVCGCEYQRHRWRAVVQQSHRWHRLRLRLERSPEAPEWTEYFRLITPNTSISFPRLQQLDVIECGDELLSEDVVEDVVQLSDEFRTAFKNLRVVILRGMVDLQSDLAVGLPWRHLTCLTLEGYGGERVGLSSLLTTLSKCDSLQRLSLSTNTLIGVSAHETVGEIAREVPKDSVTIPHLTFLAFENNGSGNYVEKRILPFLRLPSLKCLSYGSIDYDSDDWDDIPGPVSCNTLIDLFVRSGCALEELVIQFLGRLDSPSKSLAELLTLLPQLRYLCIDLDYGPHLDILGKLLLPADSGSQIPCPSLEYLRLERGHIMPPCSNTGDDHMIKVLKSRLNQNSPTLSAIKTVQIATYGKKMGSDQRSLIETGLEKEMKNGLDIQFSVIVDRYRGHYQETPETY